MNFIHHFRNVMDRMAEDQELKCSHISLYIALFQHWNRFRFRVPLAIIREDLMRASKIASTSTYTRCLKDLQSHGYLKYEPSYSPYLPSYVHIFKFEKSIRKGNGKGTRKGDGKGNRKAAENVIEPKVNRINKTNLTNTINDLNHESSHKNSFVHSDRENTKNQKTTDAGSARRKKNNTGAGRPESLEDVKTYFAEQQSTAAAAEKFYHYYESIGWKVGGRTSMKNWKASASYWLSNQKATSDETRKLKPGTLHDNSVKNYGEPL